MKNGKNRVHEYTAFFEANEHGGYTVTVPSLPGLVTDHARSIHGQGCHSVLHRRAKESEGARSRRKGNSATQDFCRRVNRVPSPPSLRDAVDIPRRRRTMDNPNDTGPQTPPGPQTLEAGEFVLKDAAGRVGARLGMGTGGKAFEASLNFRVPDPSRFSRGRRV